MIRPAKAKGLDFKDKGLCRTKGIGFQTWQMGLEFRFFYAGQARVRMHEFGVV